MKEKVFITDLLAEKFGGFWERYSKGNSIRWSSPDHNFFVYKTSEVVNGSPHQVYRRNDTREIVLRRGVAIKSNKRYQCPKCTDETRRDCLHCDGTGEIGENHVWMVHINEFETTLPLVYHNYGFYYGKKRFTAAKADALYRLKEVK